MTPLRARKMHSIEWGEPLPFQFGGTPLHKRIYQHRDRGHLDKCRYSIPLLRIRILCNLERYSLTANQAPCPLLTSFENGQNRLRFKAHPVL